MRLTLTIDTRAPSDTNTLARLVLDIATRISADEHTGKVRDEQGKVIGEFRVEEED